MINSTKKYDSLKEFKIKFKTKLSNLNKELLFYTNNDTCPTCDQDIEEEIKSKLKLKSNQK